MKKTLILLALSGIMLCLITTLNAQQTTDTIQKTQQIQGPVATVAGIINGVISKNALLKVDSLSCSEKNITIVSFTMTINKNGNLYELNSANNMLTAEMKKSINELESGNKLYFENIKAKFSDGSWRSMNAISLKIQ